MQSQALREVHDHSSDSLGSSLSMSLGGRSASVSPGPCFAASRRHSLTGKTSSFSSLTSKQFVIKYLLGIQFLKPANKRMTRTCLAKDRS